MDKIIELKIEHNLEGKTVGYVLKNCLKLSGNIIAGIKKKENIFLNGERVHTNAVVKESDELVIICSEEQSEKIIPENIPFEILYEDDDVLAVNKPKNMPTHPSKGHVSNTLANAVVFYLKGDTFRVITRLDKDTSGVVLIAKNQISAHRLNEAMKNGEIQKEYEAQVHGSPEKSFGQIEEPIRKIDFQGIKRCVAADGKSAKTLYELIKTESGFSRLKVIPVTGRTHQIRVHLSHIGLPIVGDWLYGNAGEDEKLQLECRRLEFAHPTTNKKLIIETKKEES